MQPFRDVMTKRDRTTLGGLVLAMIVGVGGSLGLAASCLGRDRAHRADDPRSLQLRESAFPEDRSARTSSGGVPGEEAVGQTQITSVELPAGAPGTNTAPPAPENAPPPNPNPTPAAAQTPRPIPVPQQSLPAPTANANVTVNVAGDQVSTSTGGGDAGASSVTPAAVPVESARDGGAANAAPTSAAPTTTTPRFATDSPPYGASSFTSNPEAGAGPFTTERNVPDRPNP